MKSIDFLPESIKAQRARRSRLIRYGYALAICAGALALFGYGRQGQIREAQAQLVQLSRCSVDVEKQLALVSSLEREQAELMIKKRIDDQLGSRADALDVLAELGHLLPESVALKSLKVEAVSLRVPVKLLGPQSDLGRAAGGTPQQKMRTVKRVQLQLTGLAPTDVDVATFIGQLSASPLFEDVSMGYAKSTTLHDRSAREFTVSCYVIR